MKVFKTFLGFSGARVIGKTRRALAIAAGITGIVAVAGVVGGAAVSAFAGSANATGSGKQPIAAAAAQTAAETATLHVGALRVEHVSEPLGIDTLAPRFSWKLTDSAPGARGTRQTAYRIRVASTVEQLTPIAGGIHVGRGGKTVPPSPDAGKTPFPKVDVWDSGFVKSGESHLVPVGAGARLRVGGDYHWQVFVRDDAGRVAMSAPARFSIGPRERSDWKGEWIRHPSAAPAEHTWFRRKFALNGQARTAFAHVASIGYHELYVNGRKADARVLAPALSHYKRRVLYVTYDIAPLLQPGDNVLALAHGPGWAIHRENAHVNPALLAQINGVTATGTAFSLHTDASWKTSAGASRDIGSIPRRMGGMGGEEVDGRRAALPWNTAAFDDAKWDAAAITKPLRAISTWPALSSANLTDASRVSARLPAVAVTPAGKDSWRADMGRAFTGFVEISFKGLAPGATVTIRVSDRASRNEVFEQQQRYIARGEDGETFTNRFNTASGRYVHISGLPAAPAPESIVALAITSAAPRTGSFTSSSPLYNRIYETDLHTYEMCTTEGFTTDCPDRERLGYGAEGAYMTLWGAGLPAFDSGAFYKKNARDWSDTQGAGGRISATAPQTYGGAWGGPLSSSALFNLAWEHYLAHGDRTVLADAFETEKRWLDFAWKKTAPDGLPAYFFAATATGAGYFLGEWLAPGHRQEMSGEPPYYFNLGALTLAHQLFAQTAAVLGKTSEAAPQRARLEKLRAGVHKKYYKGDGLYLDDIGLQVRSAFALHTGITPPAERAATLDRIAADFAGKRPYFDTGSFGRYPFYKTLFGHSRFDETVNTILSKTTYPGYGQFLERGETTWPEIWEPRDDNSARTHTSFTGISGWFVKVLAGIEPSLEGPGYRVFTLRPRVVKNLTHAAATLESPYGTIRSGWKIEGGKTVHDITVPIGSTARLVLPAAAAAILETGRPLATAPGVTLDPAPPKPDPRDVPGVPSTHLRLVSGTYRFELPTPATATP